MSDVLIDNLIEAVESGRVVLNGPNGMVSKPDLDAARDALVAEIARLTTENMALRAQLARVDEIVEQFRRIATGLTDRVEDEKTKGPPK